MKKHILQIGIAVIIGGMIVGSVFIAMQPRDFIVNIEMTEEQRVELEARLAQTQAEIQEAKKNKEAITPAMQSYLARDYAALGRLSDARKVYEAYVKTYAKDENYIYDQAMLTNYGHILMHMKDYARAQEIFEKVLVTYSVNEGDAINYVRALQAQNPNDPRVLSTLETAITLHGQTPALLIEIAGWHERQGNCQLAVEHLEIIPRLDESLAEVVQMDIKSLEEKCGR